VRVGSEPSLIPPYLTDGGRMPRIVGRACLASEMILLVENWGAEKTPRMSFTE